MTELHRPPDLVDIAQRYADRMAAWAADEHASATIFGSILSAMSQDIQQGPNWRERKWHVVVEVPESLPMMQRDRLFTIVADAVHEWEPEDRDGWDVGVYSETAGVEKHEEDEPVEDVKAAFDKADKGVRGKPS